MKKINKKGFTLVELLAVIVVLAIVMSLAVVSITGVVDDTRKKGFMDDAKSFLDGAHQLVQAGANEFAETSNFTPQCTKTGESRYIPISAINLDRGGINSPYNNKYRKGEGTAAAKTKETLSKVNESYILVKSIPDQGTYVCTYHYYIYLTDGVYAIGTSDKPASEIAYADEEGTKDITKDSVVFDDYKGE